MASTGRLKDGRFASGNTFAKGYGAPLRQSEFQRARGTSAKHQRGKDWRVYAV